MTIMCLDTWLERSQILQKRHQSLNHNSNLR